MKFGLIIAALSIACLADPRTTQSMISDILGNQGIGQNNDYAGVGNKWIGNDNRIAGVENAVLGDQNDVSGVSNAVVGATNDIIGTSNSVAGENNKIVGEGNIVQGTGNIVSNDANDIPFDIESRLPAWMRTKKEPAIQKKTVLSQTQKVVTPQKSVSPQRPQARLSPSFDRTPRATSHDRDYLSRKPSYREVIHSPGRTSVKEVYEAPNYRQQVYKTFYKGSNYGQGGDYGAWNRWDNMGWGNSRQNNGRGAYDWNTRVREDAQRSARDLRARIQSEVQENLDRAFQNAFV